MKESMHYNFYQCYTGLTLMPLNETVFQDPRFKALPFLSDEDQQIITSSVEAEAVKLAPSSSASSADCSTNPKEADD